MNERYASVDANSCNGKCALCPTCGGQLRPMTGMRATECPTCGAKWERWGAHCTTCHSDSHDACWGCKACMIDKRHRPDLIYCSNACRQRAYRKRTQA